ncbi:MULTISPECIES: type II toxin-antitoxin system PrlF family antitoxin [unclassified Sphingomonas]|uniref:type II toxin-antitoxin system PrlF family antitoxin n=1 Tax=unclassified Sphingomonas TaxID=196159 RepID=UPI002269F957|nr:MULTISPECIES: type II toxin-antitoxin system PrlF family antitoxin [unclassified Sphingomonas]
MTTIVQERSRITAKGQTTVPKAVRQALGVSYGGEIAFVVDEHGVSVRRVEAEEADPVIGAFLGFLEQDMLRNPQNVVAFPPSLADRMAALVEHVPVDRDEAIDGPVVL